MRYYSILRVRWLALLLFIPCLFVLVGCGGNDTVPGDMEGIDGCVDEIDKGKVSGWAWNLETRGKVKVELWIDGKLERTAAAERARPDLKFKDGRFGFQFQIPPSLIKDGKEHDIVVKIQGTDPPIELYGSGRKKL